jgi:hypothetical protein
MTGVNNVKSNQVTASFYAPNAHGDMRRFARSPPAAFDQGAEEFKPTIREAVEKATKD